MTQAERDALLALAQDQGNATKRGNFYSEIKSKWVDILNDPLAMDIILEYLTLNPDLFLEDTSGFIQIYNGSGAYDYRLLANRTIMTRASNLHALIQDYIL